MTTVIAIVVAFVAYELLKWGCEWLNEQHEKRKRKRRN